MPPRRKRLSNILKQMHRRPLPERLRNFLIDNGTIEDDRTPAPEPAPARPVPIPQPAAPAPAIATPADVPAPELTWPTLQHHQLNREHLIPLGDGNAVSRGWTNANKRPEGITWHWSATWDIELLTKLLGGKNAMRKGAASAHAGVGRTIADGVHIYVEPENRSWHAGKNQTLRWDGKPVREDGQDSRGSRTTIGIETVNVGFARNGVKAEDDWIIADTANGKTRYLIQPWTEEQLQLMVGLGRYYVELFPHIGVRDHHDHQDLCPGYKVDSIGLPFARLLRGIYRDPTIPDVWTPFLLVEGRQRALQMLGYDLGTSGPKKDGVDGDWGRLSDNALQKLQRDMALVDNGFWTSFVSWAVYDLMKHRGLDFGAITAG